MLLHNIYRLGQKKYFEEYGVYRNPYDVGTPEYNEFERGWMQSLKRNNGQLVRGGERWDENHTKQGGLTQAEIEIAAELYRSRKG